MYTHQGAYPDREGEAETERGMEKRGRERRTEGWSSVIHPKSHSWQAREPRLQSPAWLLRTLPSVHTVMTMFLKERRNWINKSLRLACWIQNGRLKTVFCILMWPFFFFFKVLCNGPGTCVPICVSALLLGILGIKKVIIVYVESICRVETLSLSGKILWHLSDYFIVQWPTLKEKYPKSVYLGRIVWQMATLSLESIIITDNIY